MAIKITSGDIFTPEQLSQNFKVCAGPGAGKTHFLVENVKNIITNNPIITDSKARRVLCITYTNAAVDEIVKRLNRYTDYVEAYTIHGFIIEHIIKPFQQDLIAIMKSDFDISVHSKGVISSQIEGLGILHGVDKEEIYQFIKDSNPENFKNDEFGYSKMLMGDVEVDNESFIASIVDGNGYTFKLKASNQIKPEHITAIKKYVWSKVRKLTHNEILYFGYRILQNNPTALYAIRVRFPYIFVDEFQDTNPLQTLLIKLIGEKSSVIGVIGDVAQSIYSFQGAKPSDFKDFKINADLDKEYVIADNRRSTKNIVNFCNYLRKSDTSVIQESVRYYDNPEQEKSTESKKIHFLIGDARKKREVIETVISNGGVVLTRSWAAAFDYIQGIDAEQVKVLKSIYNSYYNTPIQLRDEIVEHNNVTWVRAFRFIFNLWKSHKSGSLVDIVQALKLIGGIELTKITPKIIFKLDNLASSVFDQVSPNSNTCDIIQSYNDKIVEEYYADLIECTNNGVPLTVQIFDEQERERLVSAVSQLHWDTSYKLFTEVFSEDSKYMTVHQAKGLEWNKVIVSVMPNRFDENTIDEMYSHPKLIDENAADEFVRIYYVACSRAKEDLYIHIPSYELKEHINNSLSEFIMSSGLIIEYEFI